MSGPYSYTFRPDLKRKVQQPFTTASEFKRLETPRQEMRTSMRDAVEKRVDGIREKLEKHQQKMKPTWIAQEEKKLRSTQSMQMAHARNTGPKPPYGIANQRDAHARSVKERAESNVTQRCKEKVQTLESIERRMQRSLGRTRSR